MPTNRRSVYLADQTLVALGAGLSPEENALTSLSGRINDLVSRYSRIIASETPDFTQAEWMAIVDANWGSVFDTFSPIHVWANVEDSTGLDGKYEIETADLVAKLRSLSIAQTIAVIEVIETCHRSPPPLEIDAALDKAGIRTAKKID